MMKMMVIICQLLVINTCTKLNKDFSFLPSSTTNQIVAHNYYTLSYSEKHEQPEWVAYILSKENIEGTTKRKDEFRTDPNVETGSATLSDYKKSGYDRGHLCPAADMKLCKESMSETFFMSNMSPQSPSLNRIMWKNLESKFRKWTIEKDTLFVVTGPVLGDGEYKEIGENRVTVPDLYYKIALDEENGSYTMIGFLMPNKKCENSMDSYVVPVDSIEGLTGIDFYPDLPNRIEKKLEKSVDTTGWF